MAWRSEAPDKQRISTADVALFLGFFALCVGILGAWSRLLARRVRTRYARKQLVHVPPTFRSYFLNILRLQILFTVVPILLILAVHDVVMVVLWRGFHTHIEGTATEGIVSFCSAVVIFFFAPVILRHVLHTQSLPASPLRTRLETMCKAHRMRYRDILLWRTDHNMGNAAVMGIAGPVRYILLSDLLLETMTDEQIEAVFAHEIGHVRHKHLAWLTAFLLLCAMCLAAAGTWLYDLTQPIAPSASIRLAIGASLTLAGGA